MTRNFALALTCMLFLTCINAQTVVSNPWVKWKFLMGEWRGQGTGLPGEGIGYFSLNPDLDSKVLIRKNHADYPASNGRPAFSHNDLMVVYVEEKLPRAIYFDNEGHVINYEVSFNESTGAITLTSPTSAAGMHFRLTYTQVEEGKVKIKFEIAPADKPEVFSTYIEATAVRDR